MNADQLLHTFKICGGGSGTHPPPTLNKCSLRPPHELWHTIQDIQCSTSPPFPPPPPRQTEGQARIFHKSFPDFLTDPERCKDKQFFVDPSIYHREILLSCLNVMKGGLKKNICNLDSHAVLSEVEDLFTRWKDHIGDALEYACCFWTKHLLETPSSGSHVEEVQKAIDGFFTTCLPYWIEVLALVGSLGLGVYAINDVEQWYTSVSGADYSPRPVLTLLIQVGVSCKWANDSQRLLLENFDPICNSPSHIYYCGLPLSPPSSWLHKHYSAEFSQEVKVVKGLQTGWGTCSRTVTWEKDPNVPCMLERYHCSWPGIW
jgi:hypothetical protein